MLDLLLFPFKVVFGLLEGLFGFLGGIFEAVFGFLGGFFGLLGGIVGLCVKLTLIGIAIGAIVAFIRRHRAKRDSEPNQETFTSYYDQHSSVQ